MKGSSVASTPVASNAPTVVSSPRNDNGKSSGRGSHTSSVASLDDQDSSGYARIEDIDVMKEAAKARYLAFLVFAPLRSGALVEDNLAIPNQYSGSDIYSYCHSVSFLSLQLVQIRGRICANSLIQDLIYNQYITNASIQ